MKTMRHNIRLLLLFLYAHGNIANNPQLNVFGNGKKITE